MNTTRVPIFFKKLSLLLAILLCSVIAFMVPATGKSAPAQGPVINQSVSASEEIPFSVIAGEVSAGEAEAVLQNFEKTLWCPLSRGLMQLLYPQSLKAVAIPAQHIFFSGSRLLHSILTKGP